MRFNHIYRSLTLLTSMFFLACNTVINNNIETINLNLQPTDVNISQFTTDMEVIKLETSDDCLISYINNIKFDDKSIYVQDAVFPGIYIFDKTGRLVNKLSKQGRGFGEYLNIYDFTVDKKENTLEIFDGSSNKVLIYELYSFDFISEIIVPISTAFRFEKKDGIYYFHTHGLRNIINDNKTNSDIIAFNPETNKLAPLFDKILPDKVNRSFNVNGFAKNKENQLFFSKAWCDEFYMIDNMSAIPILAVDAGPRGVPERIKKGTYEQQEEYMNSVLTKDRYLFFRLAFYDKDDMIVLFSNGTNPYELHYYMRFGGNEYLSRNVKIDYIASNPNLALEDTFIIENTIISVLMPDKILSPELEDYLKNLDVREGDNPVLTIFNIK